MGAANATRRAGSRARVSMSSSAMRVVLPVPGPPVITRKVGSPWASDMRRCAAMRCSASKYRRNCTSEPCSTSGEAAELFAPCTTEGTAISVARHHAVSRSCISAPMVSAPTAAASSRASSVASAARSLSDSALWPSSRARASSATATAIGTAASPDRPARRTVSSPRTRSLVESRYCSTAASKNTVRRRSTLMAYLRRRDRVRVAARRWEHR